MRVTVGERTRPVGPIIVVREKGCRELGSREVTGKKIGVRRGKRCVPKVF